MKKLLLSPEGIIRLVMCACLPLILAAASNCPKPTDANLCLPTQGELCSNGCEKITGDGDTKHKDCLGETESKKCDDEEEGGSAGGTKWVYNQVKVDELCRNCGTTIEDGPDAVTNPCRTATVSTTDCGT